MDYDEDENDYDESQHDETNNDVEEEAEEDRNIFQDDSAGEEEEEGEGEDLLGETFNRDYVHIPRLDTYDVDEFDDDVDDGRDLSQIALDKKKAERKMDARDKKRKPSSPSNSRRRRLPAILRAIDEMDEDEEEGEEGEEGEEEEEGENRPTIRQKINDDAFSDAMSQDQNENHVHHDEHVNNEDDDRDDESDEGDEDEEEEEKFSHVQGNLRDWITKDDIIRFIRKRFRRFLKTYENSKGELEYVNRIRDMVEMNKCSFELDYSRFVLVETILAVWLADSPKLMLEQLELVASDVVMKSYPRYIQLFDSIHVRVCGLPIVDQIRNIRQSQLNALLKVCGVVTRRTNVFPQLQQVKYNCEKCNALIGPFFQNSNSQMKISCIACQSNGPFTINVEETIYRNYQKLTLQESPGSIPAGRLPRHKEIILLDDLIDCAKPGEEIEVTGIYVNNFDSSLNVKNGFPVFATLIEANHISKKLDQFSIYKLTDDDKNEIIHLSKDPKIAYRIIKSIAPSIYGHENIKTALALAMFGGEEKNVSGRHRLRGDINMLLLGDPGTAKSQFLKYVEKIAPRAIYTTGKGASAVGLTASVHKDPLTKEWTLEGGALVLADRGLCLIDEFDKMNDQDRVSIHEAMEQQSISISKAGIVTSLQARCSVIAAANPIGGRYDASKTFGQNVELTDPILSRFDVLIVIKDTVDPVLDEMLAKFVVESHHKSHPDDMHENNNDDDEHAFTSSDPDILPQSILKKYMTYAKQNIHPKLHEADLEKIATVYADLRRESNVGHGTPMAVRHIESMIRMAEAHAKMHLRSYVNDDDVDMAIRVLLESFIATQKYSVQKSLHRNFKKYITYKRDFNELLLHLLRQLVKEMVRYEEVIGGRQGAYGDNNNNKVIKVKFEDFEAKAREYNIVDLHPFFSSAEFANNGFSLDKNNRFILHHMD